MKNSMKAMFVVLATVICFVAASADWAVAGLDCDGSVAGAITDVVDSGGVIYVGDVKIEGVPDHLGLVEDGYTIITYFISPDEKNIACTVGLLCEVGENEMTIRCDDEVTLRGPR